MRKTTLLIMMLLLTSILAGQALAADNADLTSTLLSYTPVPAQPGSYVTVTIKVTNNGMRATDNAVIEFLDNYPFSVDNEADKLGTIGVLGTKEDYLAEYRVRIDSNAVEGTNYLKVRYTTDANSDLWFEKKLPLTISEAQKTVSINNVLITPEMIAPGDKADVQIKVKNLATSNLRDVGVKLNLEGIVVGTTYVDIPLAPIGSSVEKRISSLKSGETADFEFVLQAYPEAEAGIYKVPVTLTYTDDNGNDFTRTDLISLVINGEADILVQIDSSTLYSDNGKGTVGFSITNKGFSEMKFLTVKLVESDVYNIKSISNEVYLGNVDSDDYELAEFEIKMKEHGLNQVKLPLILTFKDALNKEYEIEETLTLQLISTADAGEKDSKTGTTIIVIAVVLVIGFLLYRRKKHKHKK